MKKDLRILVVIMALLTSVSMYSAFTAAQADNNKDSVAGAKGDNGPAGSNGVAGLRGIDGTAGLTGASSGKGDKGDRGAVGATGPQGASGANGTMWRDISPADNSWSSAEGWTISNGVLTATGNPGLLTTKSLGRGLLIGGKFEVRTIGGFRPYFNYFIDADPSHPLNSNFRIDFQYNNSMFGGSNIDTSAIDFSEWVPVSFVVDPNKSLGKIGTIAVQDYVSGGFGGNTNQEGGAISIDAMGGMNPGDKLQLRNIRYFTVDPDSLPN